MKAELSMAFEDLRGKAGTVVIQGSREGLVIRPRVKGKNPRTAAQVIVRNNMTTAAGLYKNFTTAQVQAWAAYAATQTHQSRSGKIVTPTAINAFTALASKFLQATPGGTVPTTPPSTAFTGDSPKITATGGSGIVTFTANVANATGVATELLLQPLKSRNRTPQSHGYRSKAFFPFTSGSLSTTVTVPPGWYAAGYRFVKLATGQETAIVPLTVNQVTFAIEEGNKGKKAA